MKAGEAEIRAGLWVGGMALPDESAPAHQQFDLVRIAIVPPVE